MCSHPEHQVETLPDGQIAETHVFTDQEITAIQVAVGRLVSRMELASLVFSIPPKEEVLGG